MDTPAGLSAKSLGDGVADGGHPGLATDQNHLVDVTDLKPGISNSIQADRDRPVDKVRDEAQKGGPVQGLINRPAIG